MTDINRAWLTFAIEDSRRFNLRIFRCYIDGNTPPSGTLEKEITESRADIVIIRLPAGMISPIHELIDTGHIPIHADTLVYHARQLNAPIGAQSEDSCLTTELAGTADRDRIVKIATDAFCSYRSHYHANPLLDSAAITAGYAEWAISFLGSQNIDRETWVVRSRDEIVGFATCTISNNDKSADIILNAIDPMYSGRGIYRYLLNQILISYQTRGFLIVRISTQVWNYTVQRAWAHVGFFVTHAYDTYHINTHARRS